MTAASGGGDGFLADAAAETREPAAQRAIDAALYGRQIAYMFARSAFYRTKLAAAGFDSPASVGTLDDIAALPLTDKAELRASQAAHPPYGNHLAASANDIARVFSTSGTSGTPLYIPLTRGDLARWVRCGMRAYAAAGIRPGHRVLTTYNAGPFAAGAALASFEALGCTVIPVGTGNTERLLAALVRLAPHAIPGTPSHLRHIGEADRARDRPGCLRPGGAERGR